MKVGLSFSRCLRDIIEGKVEYDNVLVIVSRTWPRYRTGEPIP